MSKYDKRLSDRFIEMDKAIPEFKFSELLGHGYEKSSGNVFKDLEFDNPDKELREAEEALETAKAEFIVRQARSKWWKIW